MWEPPIKILEGDNIKIYTYDTTDEIIFEETQKAAYEEQCLYDFIHQEQPNEDYYEGMNDYLNGTMNV